MWNLTDDLSNKDDNEDIVDNDKLRHGSSGLFWQQINDIEHQIYIATSEDGMWPLDGMCAYIPRRKKRNNLVFDITFVV